MFNMISNSDIKSLKAMVKNIEMDIGSFEGRKITKNDLNDVSKELRYIVPSRSPFWKNSFSAKKIIRHLPHLTEAIKKIDQQLHTLGMTSEDNMERMFYQNLLVKLNDFTDKLKTALAANKNQQAKETIFNAIQQVHLLYNENERCLKSILKPRFNKLETKEIPKPMWEKKKIIHESPKSDLKISHYRDKSMAPPLVKAPVEAPPLVEPSVITLPIEQIVPSVEGEGSTAEKTAKSLFGREIDLNAPLDHWIYHQIFVPISGEYAVIDDSEEAREIDEAMWIDFQRDLKELKGLDPVNQALVLEHTHRLIINRKVENTDDREELERLIHYQNEVALAINSWLEQAQPILSKTDMTSEDQRIAACAYRLSKVIGNEKEVERVSKYANTQVSFNTPHALESRLYKIKAHEFKIMQFKSGNLIGGQLIDPWLTYLFSSKEKNLFKEFQQALDKSEHSLKGRVLFQAFNQIENLQQLVSDETQQSLLEGHKESIVNMIKIWSREFKENFGAMIEEGSLEGTIEESPQDQMSVALFCQLPHEWVDKELQQQLASSKYSSTPLSFDEPSLKKSGLDRLIHKHKRIAEEEDRAPIPTWAKILMLGTLISHIALPALSFFGRPSQTPTRINPMIEPFTSPTVDINYQTPVTEIPQPPPITFTAEPISNPTMTPLQIPLPLLGLTVALPFLVGGNKVDKVEPSLKGLKPDQIQKLIEKPLHFILGWAKQDINKAKQLLNDLVEGRIKEIQGSIDQFVNQVNKQGLTPLMVAAQLEDEAFFTKLLELGADYTMEGELILQHSKFCEMTELPVEKLQKMNTTFEQWYQKQFPFHYQAQTGTGEIDFDLNNLEHWQLLNTSDGFGKRPIDYAIEKGNTSLISQLSGHHLFEPNLYNKNGLTPLHIAVQEGNLELIKALIEGCKERLKLDQQSQDKTPMTALGFAIERGAVEIAEYLIQQGAGLDEAIESLPKEVRDSQSPTIKILQNDRYSKEFPLHSQIQNNTLDLTKIDKYSQELNKLDSFGKLPIDYAIETKNESFISKLVQHPSFEPNEYNKNGFTPLITAVKSGDLELVKALVENTKKLQLDQPWYDSSLDRFQTTALAIALQNQFSDIATYLSNKGASLSDTLETFLQTQSLTQEEAEISKKWIPTLLEIEVTKNEIEAEITLILKALNKKLIDSNHPLIFQLFQYVIQKEDIKTLNNLWVAGGGKFDFSKMDPAHPSPLHLALNDGSLLMFKLLSEYVQDMQIKEPDLFEYYLNSRDESEEYGYTPLLLAVVKNNPDAVRILLEMGADPRLYELTGLSFPLHLAINKGSDEIMDLLLTLDKIYLDYRDKEGNSALHKAIQNGNLELTEKLINKGVNLNLKNNQGHTPLHLAVLAGNVDMVNLLLSQEGLELELTDNNEKMALDYAFLPSTKSNLAILEAFNNVNVTHATARLYLHVETTEQTKQELTTTQQQLNDLVKELEKLRSQEKTLHQQFDSFQTLLNQNQLQLNKILDEMQNQPTLSPDALLKSIGKQEKSLLQRENIINQSGQIIEKQNEWFVNYINIQQKYIEQIEFFKIQIEISEKSQIMSETELDKFKKELENQTNNNQRLHEEFEKMKIDFENNKLNYEYNITDLKKQVDMLQAQITLITETSGEKVAALEDKYKILCEKIYGSKNPPVRSILFNPQQKAILMVQSFLSHTFPEAGIESVEQLYPVDSSIKQIEKMKDFEVNVLNPFKDYNQQKLEIKNIQKKISLLIDNFYSSLSDVNPIKTLISRLNDCEKLDLGVPDVKAEINNMIETLQGLFPNIPTESPLKELIESLKQMSTKSHVPRGFKALLPKVQNQLLDLLLKEQAAAMLKPQSGIQNIGLKNTLKGMTAPNKGLTTIIDSLASLNQFYDDSQIDVGNLKEFLTHLDQCNTLLNTLEESKKTCTEALRPWIELAKNLGLGQVELDKKFCIKEMTGRQENIIEFLRSRIKDAIVNHPIFEDHFQSEGYIDNKYEQEIDSYVKGGENSYKISLALGLPKYSELELLFKTLLNGVCLEFFQTDSPLIEDFVTVSSSNVQQEIKKMKDVLISSKPRVIRGGPPPPPSAPFSSSSFGIRKQDSTRELQSSKEDQKAAMGNVLKELLSKTKFTEGEPVSNEPSHEDLDLQHQEEQLENREKQVKQLEEKKALFLRLKQQTDENETKWKSMLEESQKSLLRSESSRILSRTSSLSKDQQKTLESSSEEQETFNIAKSMSKRFKDLHKVDVNEEEEEGWNTDEEDNNST